MQISKTRSRNGSPELQAKTSSATGTLRSKHQTRVVGSASKTSTIVSQSQAPAQRSRKVEGRTAKTMATEKRRPSMVTELECQLVQLQEDLKKTKDQFNSAELSKRQAQLEADAAKHQLVTMSEKLHDSQTQMVELSAAEEARIQELRKISQERDRAWQFEVEAIQKQHSIDSSALASAMDEVQRLKRQLQTVRQFESELAKKSEVDRLQLQSSKQDLADALITIENLGVQLQSSEQAEAEAKSTITEMKKQLGIAQSTIESLLTDGSKLMESFSILATELKESRLQIRLLEETAKKLQEENSIPKSICFNTSDDEVEQLMSAFEESLIKHQQEQIQSLVKSQCAYESLEKMSTDFKLRESELESRLNNTKSEVTRWKSKLFDREVELQTLSDTNKKLLAETEKAEEKNHIEAELGLQLTQSVADVADLKTRLAEKEEALATISEENEQLKIELKNTQMNSMKLGFLFEEEEKDRRRGENASEETISAQAVKSEMEAELRKLRVQAEQWRKAAETAILMLTAEGAADFEMRLPFTDESDDQPSRKKKNNVLRRFSEKWNKDHK